MIWFDINKIQVYKTVTEPRKNYEIVNWMLKNVRYYKTKITKYVHKVCFISIQNTVNEKFSNKTFFTTPVFFKYHIHIYISNTAKQL